MMTKIRAINNNVKRIDYIELTKLVGEKYLLEQKIAAIQAGKTIETKIDFTDELAKINAMDISNKEKQKLRWQLYFKAQRQQ